MQMQSHGWSATCALCELAKHLNLSKRMAHAGDEPCVISVRFASIQSYIGTNRIPGIGTSLPRQVTSVSTAFDTYSVDYIS
jgi:hypothetical protein